MYGYNSYRPTLHPYTVYDPTQAGSWYGDESRPGPAHSSDCYGEYYGQATYADGSWNSNYYDRGYHEAGAPSSYQQHPMNLGSYEHYQQAQANQSHSPRRAPRAPKAMREREWDVERERARRREEDQGHREATPPPVPSPSPEYLAIAAGPPSSLSNPASSRKLLVLDLNGTLVYRSPHASRPKYRPQDRGVPRLRPTYPRPYMRAFCDYVFAPETKTWLDVMVWSSAQPHSVGDMVDKCFGKRKRELVAVWARDTLGLSSDHYHRKIQTIKDLSRPWAALPALLTPLPPSPSHSPDGSTPPPPSSSPPESPPSPVQPAQSIAPQMHSALTTLLLDDSPKKAIMQPYNHFCIPEYTQERRNKDLDSFQKEQEWALVLEKRKVLQSLEQLAEATTRDASGLPSLYGESDEPAPRSVYASEHKPDPESKSKKRKRKREKSARAQSSPSPPSAAEGFSPSSHLERSKPESKPESKKAKRRRRLVEGLAMSEADVPRVEYDETLLAVVGVLDTVRCQRNVAAWTQAGGLWGPSGVPKHVKHPASSGSSSVLGSGEESPETKTEPEQSVQDDEKCKEVRQRALRQHAGDEAVWKATAGERQTERLSAVNDEALKVAGPVAGGPEESGSSMWFEDPYVVAYWARRGREVLEELGIPVKHGMEW